MNNQLFIFKYTDCVFFDSPKSVTVVFANQEHLNNQEYVADEIKRFFQVNTISDYLLVLIPDYLNPLHAEWFMTEKEITFKRLPGKSSEYFANNYFVYTYDKSGAKTPFYKSIVKKSEDFFKHLFRHGSTQIFKSNGGLVESSNDHHFVFPSNKHCSKFIRTGNVLVNSPEVFFLAFQLLPYFAEKQNIYCDTSSINVLPFAAFELKRRFKQDFPFPNILSFKSYDVFESRTTRFSTKDLILISSSTSGNIIDRMLAQRLASKEQILLIYYLGSEERYVEHYKNIICNLTWNKSNFDCGVEEFETYPSKQDCRLCKNNSYAIRIEGDVFLTVKPKIKKVLLTATPKHVPKFLDEFVNAYHVNKSLAPDDAIIRAYYKETKGDSEANYETYIDTSRIYGAEHFKDKLDRLINKHIPANTRYLIHLPDESSKTLATIINSRCNWPVTPSVLKLDDELPSKLSNDDGSAVIVGSCIVTGKNLLHVSRMMRKFDKLSIVYFIGVMGTNNESYLNTLRSSLSRGKNKSDDRPFISVETIYCSLDKYETIWARELLYIESKIIPECKEEGALQEYLKARAKILRENKATIGLTDSLFLKTHTKEDLVLRKNFAFWSFAYEEEEIFQSEVFFTINSIVNFLENKEIASEGSLQQSNYIRTILSPENFQRFNDGIIQACLLRASKPEYLAYHLDPDSSKQMTTLIESQLEKENTEHGEAIMEFLLAMGMKTLRLSRNETSIVLERARGSKNAIVSEFASIILLDLTEEHIL